LRVLLFYSLLPRSSLHTFTMKWLVEHVFI
jgi:hypothetical protein